MKNNWFMKAKANTAKWLENLGKATIVYKDDKGLHVRREALSEEQAKALIINSGAEPITFNGKLFK